MTRPSVYIAFDPGHTSGWATFDENGDVIEMGQFTLDELSRIKDLIHEDIKAVIVEDYKNHGYMQQKRWGRNETSKVIGRIEAVCDMLGVPAPHLQPNTVRAIGYKWMGSEQPKNHSISHSWDACAHGVYWLQTNGIRPVGRSMMKEKKND